MHPSLHKQLPTQTPCHPAVLGLQSEVRQCQISGARFWHEAGKGDGEGGKEEEKGEGEGGKHKEKEDSEGESETKEERQPPSKLKQGKPKRKAKSGGEKKVEVAVRAEDMTPEIFDLTEADTGVK